MSECKCKDELESLRERIEDERDRCEEEAPSEIPRQTVVSILTRLLEE